MSAHEDSRHPYRVGIVVSSDRSSRGEQEDLSGPLIREMVEAEGFLVANSTLLPDEQALLEAELRHLCDGRLVDLILTTGGTGFSPRDLMPEATTAVAERLVPGIGEAMRLNSLNITPRAMLSRGIAAIRGETLIINLPGSPKAVRENLGFIISTLRHGLDMLTGR
jgi:molybdenum cofactor synthesis domain-containing protein